MASLINRTGLGLSFIHLNTQSLYSKIGEMRILVNDVNPDLLCLSETWLSDKIPDGLIELPGYSVFRADRLTHKRGGGLACYVNNNIVEGFDANKHRTIWKSNEHIELQLFELKIRHIKKMIIVNVYRPPAGKLQNFMDELYNALYSIDRLNEFEIYVMGDCNLPFNQSQSVSSKKLQEFGARFGLRQVIDSPTRYSLNTANILDLIFTNSKYIQSCGTWDLSLSDHQPVYIVRKKARVKIQRTTFTCRNFFNYDKGQFRNDLSEYDWGPFFLLKDPNEAWSFLYRVLNTLADKHCPYKEFVSKKVIPNWMSQNVLEHIKE